jgi:hypothetical protein
MSLLTICQWLQDTYIGTGIRESLLVFPLIESTHVLGLAISVGSIIVVDLRLIGAVMRSERLTDVLEQLQPWTLTGFAVMFLSGALLFWCEAAKCYVSTAFRIKMLFLLGAGINALLFHTRIYRRVADWDADAHLPASARFAGWAGLILWTGVIAFGRWTAYGMK